MSALTAFISRGGMANLATSATQRPEEAPLVAKVARVATAQPADHPEISAQLDRIMGRDHPDFLEALAHAVADPEGLATLKRTTSQNVPEAVADDLDELRHAVTQWHEARGTFIPDGALELERLKRIPLAQVPRELAEWRRFAADESNGKWPR